MFIVLVFDFFIFIVLVFRSKMIGLSEFQKKKRFIAHHCAAY